MDEISASSDVIFPVMMAVLGSNVLTAVISALLGRKKSGAEIKAMENDSEAVIHKTLLEYADGMREDLKNLRNELSQAYKDQDELRAKYEQSSQSNSALRLDEAIVKKCPILKEEYKKLNNNRKKK